MGWERRGAKRVVVEGGVLIYIIMDRIRAQDGDQGGEMGSGYWSDIPDFHSRTVW